MRRLKPGYQLAVLLGLAGLGLEWTAAAPLAPVSMTEAWSSQLREPMFIRRAPIQLLQAVMPASLLRPIIAAAQERMQ